MDGLTRVELPNLPPSVGAWTFENGTIELYCRRCNTAAILLNGESAESGVARLALLPDVECED